MADDEIARKAAIIVERVVEVEARVWLIPSASYPGAMHRVSLIKDADTHDWLWACPCEAGRFGRRCYHVDAAKLLIAEEGVV